ncbi:MAG: hypothetical protein ACUVTM_08710 [Candidatus Bathyarchaeia archaeon]
MQLSLPIGLNYFTSVVPKVEEATLRCGYRPIELCWMIWLIQFEGGML